MTMNDRNLSVGCAACKARVGEQCVTAKPHARSRWIEGVHFARWQAAREAHDRHVEMRTAYAIATWLEDMGALQDGQRSQRLASLADLVRTGAWRPGPEARATRHPG
jgi:hypothetical protein